MILKKNEIKVVTVNSLIELKEVELVDVPDIFHTIDTQREHLGKWLPFVSATQKIEDTKSYVQSIVFSPRENREYVFVIRYKKQFAGLIGFRGTDKLNKKTEIGYWLSELFQKKGIITESVKSLIHFAYNELDMNRIQIRCAVGNISSHNVPKRLGFTFEGIERAGELQSDGTFSDLEIYSKLKTD